MTDMSKYKNVSLTKETYATLDKLSKVLLPDAKLSIAKTIESIANECMPPYPWPDTFRTQYDCLHFGYEESQRKLEEIGREDINKYGMYIKFTCKADDSI